MAQTRNEVDRNLAERLCWEVAHRDDSRVARRLYRTQVVDGAYRLDEGALLDDFFPFLQGLGGMALLEQVQGTAIQRVIVPCVQHVLLYGLKTLFGIESMNALPAFLFSDEALMQLVGFNAQQVRDGVCQRGASTRQGEHTPGPMGPDTLARNMVKLNLRQLRHCSTGPSRHWRRRGASVRGTRGWWTPPIWRRRTGMRAVAKPPASAK